MAYRRKAPVTREEADPKDAKDGRAGQPARPPKANEDPPKQEIRQLPTEPDRRFDAQSDKQDRLARAAVRPPPGVDIDDPNYQADLAEWVEERNRQAEATPEPQQGQDEHPPVVDGVPHVRVVQPETFDQRTPQMSDVPVDPGNMTKSRTVATDPSQIRISRPAGEEARSSGVDPEQFLDMIPGLRENLQTYVRAIMAAERSEPPPPNEMAQYFPGNTGEGYRPADFLGHYRNDVDKEKRIARMDVPDNPDDPRAKMIHNPDHRGQWMYFHNGHFFAEEQWQKDQLDWMMAHGRYDPRVKDEVLGGDPHIYEHVEDQPVHFCPTPGCDFVAGSDRALAAHRKATHGG